MMKKIFTLVAMGLVIAYSPSVIAQQDAAATPAATAADTSCKNKVQVTDLSGTEQGGGKNFDYFIQIKNVTDKNYLLDIKFDKFPESTRLYGPVQKDVKVKAKKTQTIRFGTGINNNVSVASITVQVDKDKPGKKPTISIVNCREKK
ncbi:MAG: hypothetical protein JSS87_05660 [Acidobacteria bacterium]|nr:hypothetical protein [Acidobacteriota bacterium]